MAMCMAWAGPLQPPSQLLCMQLPARDTLAAQRSMARLPCLSPSAPAQGPNLLKLSRKEQCLALLTQLCNKFKTDGSIYHVFPNGEVCLPFGVSVTWRSEAMLAACWLSSGRSRALS